MTQLIELSLTYEVFLNLFTIASLVYFLNFFKYHLCFRHH